MKVYPKGEVVVPAKERYPYLSLITGGILAKGFYVAESTKAFSHSILLPGSTVGDFYLMSGTVCNLRIIALRDTHLIEVPHSVVKKQMRSDAAFMDTLLNQLMENTASDSEGLATITARPAEERLKILMKILLVRYSVVPQDGWYKIPVMLTHEEMSRIIYATPLTVNRLFIKFRKEGMIMRNPKGRFLHKSLFDDIWDWYEDDPLIQLH